MVSVYDTGPKDIAPSQSSIKKDRKDAVSVRYYEVRRKPLNVLFETKN